MIKRALLLLFLHNFIIGSDKQPDDQLTNKKHLNDGDKKLTDSSIEAEIKNIYEFKWIEYQTYVKEKKRLGKNDIVSFEDYCKLTKVF